MKIVRIVEYRLNRYFYSSRTVMPLIAIICFIGFLYSVAPMDVCSGYLMSGIFQFMMMTFVTLSMNGSEDIVEEQLLLFRGNGWGIYCVARELTLIVIACAYGLVFSFAPVLVNLFSFFTRTLTMSDTAMGAIIIFGSGLAGIAVGDALHPRIVKDRKMAVAVAVVIMILSIVKNAVIEKYNFFRFFGILFPSVMKPVIDVGNRDYFDLKSTASFLLMMTIYYMVVAIIKNVILSRNKFK